jgi:hypothetical protein
MSAVIELPPPAVEVRQAIVTTKAGDVREGVSPFPTLSLRRISRASRAENIQPPGSIVDISVKPMDIIEINRLLPWRTAA